MAQYIYSMVRARKAHGDKVILDDVTLAFLPGAKIGVVGPNGAGKSTVLKIMAGKEQASNGEAILTPGYSVGMLEQEPHLNEKLDVRGNVSASVSKGDPVIVHGALTTHSWESDSGPRSKPRIKAFAVGHSLTKGRALFTRDKSGRNASSADAGGSIPTALDDAPHDAFLGTPEELLAGRDYVDADEALHEENPADLSAEPAHV